MKERKIAKKYVEVNLGSLPPYDFDGTIDDAISLLMEKKEELKEFKNVKIDFSEDGFELYGERLETDTERDRRQRQIEKEKEKKHKESAEHREYIQKEAKKLGIV